MQLFVRHLSHIDCSYLDATHGVMGTSWIVDIILDGVLDEQGMVMDFSDVKKHIKDQIDASLDHTLLVAADDPNLHIKEEAESYHLTYQCAHGVIEHLSPKQAVTLLSCQTIDATVIKAYLERDIQESLQHHSLAVHITIREEAIDGAWYCYSHGLKQHGGNCQRIAHGHRSQIHIFHRHQRHHSLESVWAERWHGRYLANRHDVLKTQTKNGIDYTVFAYEANQGYFQLTLPTACCYLLDEETTVEHLAQHIADRLTAETGLKELAIHAFEGVDKGAIAMAPR